MSSRYRERDRDWDEVSRHSDPRTSFSTVTRYVIADDRSSAPSRREDYPSSSNDRQQIAIRTLDRDDRDTMPRRYDYEYNLDTDYDRGFFLPSHIFIPSHLLFSFYRTLPSSILIALADQV